MAYSIWGRGVAESASARYSVRFVDEGDSEPRGRWHCAIRIGRTAVATSNGLTQVAALRNARFNLLNLRRGGAVKQLRNAAEVSL